LAYDLTHWTTFLAAAILLNLSPGPDIAFILGHTVKGGARAGTAAMLGIWLGTFGHIVFAVSGLSALLAASALSFSVVKWVGVAYLIWIGIQSIRSAWRVITGGISGAGGTVLADLPPRFSDRSAQPKSGDFLSRIPAAVPCRRRRAGVGATPAARHADHRRRGRDRAALGDLWRPFDGPAQEQSQPRQVAGQNTGRVVDRLGSETGAF
jgi:hypothetical protein